MNVSLSAERVLESLEQKGEGNDSMSSGEVSENVRIKARGYSMHKRRGGSLNMVHSVSTD